eukprot:Pompholyxophrys_sp_v1_NODE_12_length_5133_cov_3.790272.p2 type:complete len:148 gc:universal NODE_12_length_5133_cov_3.790272:876-433(-)
MTCSGASSSTDSPTKLLSICSSTHKKSGKILYFKILIKLKPDTFKRMSAKGYVERNLFSVRAKYRWRYGILSSILALLAFERRLIASFFLCTKRNNQPLEALKLCFGPTRSLIRHRIHLPVTLCPLLLFSKISFNSASSSSRYLPDF